MRTDVWGGEGTGLLGEEQGDEIPSDMESVGFRKDPRLVGKVRVMGWEVAPSLRRKKRGIASAKGNLA